MRKTIHCDLGRTLEIQFLLPLMTKNNVTTQERRVLHMFVTLIYPGPFTWCLGKWSHARYCTWGVLTGESGAGGDGWDPLSFFQVQGVDPSSIKCLFWSCPISSLIWKTSGLKKIPSKKSKIEINPIMHSQVKIRIKSATLRSESFLPATLRSENNDSLIRSDMK